MKPVLEKIFDVLAGFKLAVGLLFFVFVATWLGTLAQKDIGLLEAQRKYFESLVYIGPEEALFGFLRFPLPGGMLLLSLLAVNLVLGGIVRLRKSWSRAGILVMHTGVVMLLVAGWVRLEYAEDGSIGLLEGERGDEYIAFHEYEVAVGEIGAEGVVREWVVTDEALRAASGDSTSTASFAGEPLRLSLSGFALNARVVPAGVMPGTRSAVVDGFAVQSLKPETEAEFNRPACYVTAFREGAAAQGGILWLGAEHPWTVRAADRTYVIELRKRRYPLPFSIELVKFTHEYHPGTDMPRHFQSDVLVHDGTGTPQPQRVRMNEPLRRDGFVAYQHQFRETNSTQLYSELQVVKNPADQWPLWSLLVMTAGMLAHFVTKLVRWIVRETKTLQAGATR